MEWATILAAATQNVQRKTIALRHAILSELFGRRRYALFQEAVAVVALYDVYQASVHGAGLLSVMRFTRGISQKGDGALQRY